MKIAIITNVTKDIGLVTTMRVVELLQGKADVYMCDECVLPKVCDVTYLPYEELWKMVDIAVVLGGDGTLLGAASQCAMNSIPALGINLGKVGFLTEVESTDIETAIDCILNGRYITEKRMLLKMRVNDEEKSYHALNDIVMSKPEGIKLIGIDLYTDEQLVSKYIADGMIIASPTGSTGYSISAGGPVVDPRMSLYIATPICAHMLAARSAILPSEHDIVIKLSRDYMDNAAIISTDGEKQRIITVDDEVRISKSDYEFELVRIGTSSFYNTLVSKLS